MAGRIQNMKDLIISGQRLQREALIFAGCLVVALGVNVYSILRFKTEWKELFTTLPITLCVALAFYAGLALLRALTCGSMRLVRRKAA